VILFSVSWSVVELEEWGIIFDKNLQEIEAKPYPSGRYLAGNIRIPFINGI